jgi:predicted PurR-regulated permease PerM
MTITNFRHAFLVLLVVAVSVAFFAMVRAFLLTILMAALFTGLSYPLYRWMVRLMRGRARLAALATLLVLLALVIAPLLSVLGVAAAEAVRVNETLLPRLQALVDEPGELDRRLQALPGYDLVEPYRDQIIVKAREFAGTAGAFALDVLSATTRATVLFIFHFIVMLYTMYFFLTDGPSIVQSILAYLPLTDADKQRMLGKFVSVARATLKGTLLIGAAQGGLAGLGSSRRATRATTSSTSRRAGSRSPCSPGSGRRRSWRCCRRETSSAKAPWPDRPCGSGRPRHWSRARCW